jgi:hypothetical protein
MAEARPEASTVAARLGRRLEQRGVDYAIGGALALGYWGEPRGTLDVDLTLFLVASEVGECLSLLQACGCKFSARSARETLEVHGYCRVSLDGVDVNVFLPVIDFYDTARTHRCRVVMEGESVYVWSAEVLPVQKLIFFRKKDLLDIQNLLGVQGPQLDTAWVRARLVEIFGPRDPRIPAWDELVADVGE